MRRIFSIIFFIVVLLLVTGCSPKQNSSVDSNITREIKDYSEQIVETQDGFTVNNNLVVIARNNATEIVDLTIIVDFYDVSNTLINSEKSYYNGVGPGVEVATQIIGTPANYYRHEISFEAKSSIYTKTFVNDIKLTHKKDLTVFAKIKNNTKEVINYISASVVYYQGNIIVGYDTKSVFDVKSGQGTDINFYQPNDSSYNEVPYDNYRIFINEAYSYNYKY